jgi:hypothetical protein
MIVACTCPTAIALASRAPTYRHAGGRHHPHPLDGAPTSCSLLLLSMLPVLPPCVPPQACWRGAAASLPCSRWRSRCCRTQMTTHPSHSSTQTSRVGGWVGGWAPACLLLSSRSFPLLSLLLACFALGHRPPGTPACLPAGPPACLLACWPTCLPADLPACPFACLPYQFTHLSLPYPAPAPAAEDDILLRQELDDLAAAHPNFR